MNERGVSCPKVKTGAGSKPDPLMVYRRKKTSRNNSNERIRNYYTNPLASCWRSTLGCKRSARRQASSSASAPLSTPRVPHVHVLRSSHPIPSVSTIRGGVDTRILSPGRSPKQPLPGIRLHDPLHGRQACPEFNSFHQGVGQISPRQILFSYHPFPKRRQICDVPAPPNR